MFRYSPFILLLAAFIGLTAFAFRNASSSRVDRVRAYYLDGIDSLASSVDALDSAVRRITDADASVKTTRDAFQRARASYKRIEFLIGYFDQLAAGKMNAPALERVNESDLQRSVVEPEGFQVIEEILFGDEAHASGEELLRLSDRLRYRVRKMREYARIVPMTDRDVFEAMRKQILRVALTGVTGFDSPVALNSIPEARHALAGIRDGLDLYLDELSRRAPSVAARLVKGLDAAQDYLAAHDDFNAFDRMEFIRDRVNPLYAGLLAAHLALGYPTYAQVSALKRPVRYEADNIFEADAFDPFFYSPDPVDFYREERAELGRLLFFDPVLSKDLRRSCASCHRTDLAFTDGRRTSLDLSGESSLSRNAPTLINAVFQSKFFWDGRTEHLEHQIEDVLLNHSEMRGTFEEIIDKLRRSPEYRRMFVAAYEGTSDTLVTKFGIVKGLASYLRTLVALDSPFDRYMRGETGAIEPEVRRGFNLFMGKAKCGTCHFAPVFNGTIPPDFLETETEVLGVPATPDTLHPVLDFDAGRYGRFFDEIYRRSFKTPTVRNAALTAPYMHNGVYGTLEEVIDFYDRGGGIGLGLDVPNQTLPPDRLNLTGQEKADLIAFMRSLTDTAGTTTRPDRLPEFPDRPEWNGRGVGH